jgi:hypothetical protein
LAILHLVGAVADGQALLGKPHLERDVLVLPSCGVAIVAPRSCSAAVMPGRTTSCAPPSVAPATSRTASPSDCANALMAGPDPM